MKRLGVRLTAAAAIVVFALSAAGCAEKKNPHGLDPASPTGIIVWNYYTGDQEIAFRGMVNEFNSTVGKETGIVVTNRPMGSINEIATKIIASADKEVDADALPDVFSAYADTAYEMDKRGLLVDCTQYLTKEELAGYVPGYLEEGDFAGNGELKIFPIGKATEVLIVNKTDWDKFSAATGASEEKFSTWEGIAELAGDYHEWSDGKAFFGRDAFANYMIVGSRQLGKEILKVEAGEVTYQTDRTVLKKLWDNFYVPYVKGYYLHGGKFRTDDIGNGKIVACVGSTTSSTYFPATVDDMQNPIYGIESKVYALPNFAGTDPFAVQQGAGMAVVKSGEEKREYASTVFLKWFTDSERNLGFSAMSSYLPVMKAANTTEAFERMIAGDGSMKPLLRDTLRVSMRMTQDYRMYAPKAFDDSYSARTVLDDSMESLAVSDAAAIAKGEKQLSDCLTDAYFEKWVQSLSAALNAL